MAKFNIRAFLTFVFRPFKQLFIFIAIFWAIYFFTFWYAWGPDQYLDFYHPPFTGFVNTSIVGKAIILFLSWWYYLMLFLRDFPYDSIKNSDFLMRVVSLLLGYIDIFVPFLFGIFCSVGLNILRPWLKKYNLNGYKGVILCIVVIFLLSVGGAYYSDYRSIKVAYQNQDNNISHWKIYRDDKFDFEIKYPPAWSFSKDKDFLTNDASWEVYVSNKAYFGERWCTPKQESVDVHVGLKKGYSNYFHIGASYVDASSENATVLMVNGKQVIKKVDPYFSSFCRGIGYYIDLGNDRYVYIAAELGTEIDPQNNTMEKIIKTIKIGK